MKTNQLMKRKMGEFNVTQRTKDGFFCATELLRQWNEYANLNRGNSPYLKQKDLKEFFSNKNTKEFIDALLEEEKLSTKNLAYLKSRGKSGGTWMHPVLFVKFAMWLNPRFEVQVIKFVYDEMIKYRNEAGESFVSIYNRILKRPEEIDPRIVENRRKLAVLGDVGATLAEIIGVAAGGNAAARKPATAVNNAFLQNLLDRRYQMQMLYDQGLLKAAFQDKVGRDAAQAAEAQREYEGALAEWERANELNDLLMKFGFEAGESEKERSNKKSINDANNATKIQIAADNNKTKYGIASMKNKGSDLYKKGSDIPLSGGKRIKISESELPFSAGSLFQAARQAVIDAGLGDEKITTKNEYGRKFETSVTEQLLRIDDMLRNNPNSAKTAIQEIGSLMRKYPQIEQKVLEAAENIGLYIEGIEQPNKKYDKFPQYKIN